MQKKRKYRARNNKRQILGTLLPAILVLTKLLSANNDPTNATNNSNNFCRIFIQLVRWEVKNSARHSVVVVAFNA